MTRRLLLLSTLVSLGCGRPSDDRELARKVAQLERRVLKLESSGARGTSKVRAHRRRPPTAPSPEATVAVLVEGDAQRVFLRTGDRRLPLPGRVPPGDYEIRARFELDTPVVAAGNVELTDGEAITIVCNGTVQICRRQ